MRTERLRREFGLNLRWTVFPLHPDTPDAGLELADLFAGRGYDIEAMLARLRRVADELDLSLGERTRTYNSRRAQELGKWAESLGAGESFHAAVYRAYFVAGKNISRSEVLAQLAQRVGLPADEARAVLASGSFAAAVDADWDRALSQGVSAVPTVLYRDRKLVGFHPYSSYRGILEE